LGNYVELFSDDDVIHATWITIYYCAGFLVLTVPAALVLAVLLDRKLKGRGFYQSVVFMPVVLAMVVVAMVWRAVLAPNEGLYQLFTVPFGISGVQWLNDPALAMPSLIVVSAWKSVGYYLVIFLAGLQSIPRTLYEAARIDGAGPWRIFWAITLPMLRPYLLFVTVVSVVRTSQAFGAIYALTGGGPVDATTVLPFLIYQNAFQYNRMGYASAIAVVQFRLLRTEA
jgi:ABC-type sugar transport system permease subunit